MIVFFGFSILDRIQNPKKYKIAIKQIQHFLTLHSQKIKIIQNDYLLTIKPLYNHNQFTILKDNNYLTTSFYRVHFNDPITQQQIAFFQVCMECALILKQHFPSKIDIQMNTQNTNLKYRLGSIMQHNKIQLTRRYISNLKIIMSNNNTFSDIRKDQLQDILYLIRTQESSKLKNLGLSILNRVPQGVLSQLKQIDTQSLEILGCQNQQYQKIVSQIIGRIIRSKTNIQGNNNLSINTYQAQQTVNHGNYNKYDEPSLLESYLFQLKQSKNIERLCFLIDRLSDHVSQLSKDKNECIDNIVFEVIYRFLNDEYANKQKFGQLFKLSLLKFGLSREYIKNWQIYLRLLNERSGQQINQDLKNRVQQFCNHFIKKTDQKIVNQLKKIKQKYSHYRRDKIQKMSRKIIQDQQNNNSRTSRITNSKSFRKTFTKSTILNL